ncbi:MAG: phage antirepressor KilAC domain-containing protein [Spirochaetia bacterium]|nr:phage antirepressor KilAC domain-containing protein [Spirochaetia bacterium]
MENSQLIQQSKDLILQLTEALVVSNKSIKEKNEILKEIVPLAQFGELVISDRKHYSMKEAADMLEESIKEETGMHVGRNDLFGHLRDMSILSSNSSNWNQPFGQFVKAGYFKTKIKETPKGMVTVTLVTGKGLQYIQKKVIEYIACS